jgi:hypothetical protein
MTATNYGYLSRPYLNDTDGYLAGVVHEASGMQVNRVIPESLASAFQINRTINEQNSNGFQVERIISAEEPSAFQVNREIAGQSFSGFQVDRSAPGLVSSGFQIDRTLLSDEPSGMQVERTISNRVPFGTQVERDIIGAVENLGMEIRRSNYISIVFCPNLGYLATPYLSGPYLVAEVCASTGWQVNRSLKEQTASGFQVNRVITSQENSGMQVERIINAVRAFATQVERIIAFPLGFQVRMVLYNTKKIRILCDFPSRGAAGAGNNAWGQPKGTGANWIATNTRTGDFSPNNVNTDLVEEVWRSDIGVTTASLSCDTELIQGTAPDTIAVLNHNWSSSAVVVLEGSNSDTFASIEITIPIEATSINSYYIAPTLPTSQYRYWRLSMSDPTNPNGFLQVGTIIFGSAIIFQGENIIDQVRKREIHFSDKVNTEGFTNVSNDRALKRAVSIGFNQLNYDKGNYLALANVFQTARTSLKCLWIPDPQKPGRFAVFGKLTEIPEEEHENRGNAADIVTMRVEVDESR